MAFRTKRVGFSRDLLSQMATDLLERKQGKEVADLSQALVLLPSARACRTLGHILLEKSGGPALLLPRLLTVAQLFGEASCAQGLDTAPVPDDSSRQLILAHHLARLSWLKDTPENAPGLAAEFLAIFDELRLHGRADLLQGKAAVAAVQAAGHAGAAEVLQGDTLRLAEVWQIYRRQVARDAVDVQVETAANFGRTGKMEHLLVAGFGRMDRVQADLVGQLLDHSTEGVLYLAGAEDLLSRFFISTWGDSADQLGPLAPSGRVQDLLGSTEAADPTPGGTLRQRLDALGDLSSLWAPDGPLTAARCRNQEEESRLVAHQVVQILMQPDGATQKTAVLTNDPILAERIVAQLWDAGVDVDNTLGSPLAALPAGLLLRFMLRAALTELRPEILLEVLTHPDTDVGASDGPARERLVLDLERMLRAQEAPPSGPDGLLRLARQRDLAAAKVSGSATTRMQDYLTLVVAAFEPLLEVARGSRQVGEFIDAARRSWQLLAGETPLVETKNRPDVTGADNILDLLETDQAWLPPTNLAGFAADLNRLLKDTNIAPHRREGLPVLVAGLVEARLENYDHLIIAGLNEGVFPTRSRRPLIFDATTRRRLGLPTWREGLARDAELFLRLLHNAPLVLLTWSCDEGGRPLLPSPFVERLLLGRTDQKELVDEAPAPKYRQQAIPTEKLVQAQQAFAAESLDVPLLAKARPLANLSWTALRHWRECPYRFLLERGFALRKPEEVQEEFGRREVGNLIHQVMRDFLVPGAEGQAALDGGDRSAAESILTDLARQEFARDGDSLPGRKLWLASFLDRVPEIVAVELAAWDRWCPARLETRFRLPLPDLAAWLEAKEGKPIAPVLNEAQQAIVLEGAIDRVDTHRQSADCRVIDYKTGTLPPSKAVTDLKDLQLLLYSLAIECGAVTEDPRPRTVIEAGYYGISAKGTGPGAKPAWSQDRALLTAAGHELLNLAVQAADPAGPFPLLSTERQGEGTAQLPCQYCDFRGACRLEERPDLPAETTVKIAKLVGRKEGGLF